MFAAESSPLVEISVSVITAIGLIIVALISVMFKVNEKRNNKQDSDHATNHNLLVGLQTSVIGLQNDFKRHQSDHLTQEALQAEGIELQKEASRDALVAAQVLKKETVEAAKVLAEATALVASALSERS